MFKVIKKVLLFIAIFVWLGFDIHLAIVNDTQTKELEGLEVQRIESVTRLAELIDINREAVKIFEGRVNEATYQFIDLAPTVGANSGSLAELRYKFGQLLDILENEVLPEIQFRLEQLEKEKMKRRA